MKFRMGENFDVILCKIGYVFSFLLFVAYIIIVFSLKGGASTNIILFLLISFFIGKILDENSKKLKQLIIDKEHLYVKSWKEQSSYKNQEITIVFQKYNYTGIQNVVYFQRSIVLEVITKDGTVLNKIVLYDLKKIDELKECFDMYEVKWESNIKDYIDYGSL